MFFEVLPFVDGSCLSEWPCAYGSTNVINGPYRKKKRKLEENREGYMGVVQRIKGNGLSNKNINLKTNNKDD